MGDLMDEMRHAEEDFATLPEWAKPVVTDENALIAGQRSALTTLVVSQEQIDAAVATGAPYDTTGYMIRASDLPGVLRALGVVVAPARGVR